MLEILYSGERKALDKELLCRIGKDAKSGKRITLLVPEQQVYSAENMLSYNGIMSPELEVVGFRRLCESVFRRFGGLAYNNITDGARLILMWRTVAALAPSLKEYGNIALDDIDMIKSLLASVSELSLYGVSPKVLEEHAQKIKKDNERLARKLEDLSLIAAANSALLKNEYNDPAEDTRRAVETLSQNDYFSGRTVYVAHFVSFSVYEKQLIDIIVSHADEVCVTLGMDQNEGREIFDTLRDTESFILRCAASHGKKPIRTHLVKDCTHRSAEIAHFVENIWDFGAKKYPKKCENIRIAVAENAEDEAKFVASDIARRLREGGVRYRDFAIIVRSTADYEGIIDRVLELYGLPSFISSRGDIKMRPAIRMILLALKIRSHNWQTEDVVSYVRCGFSGLSEDACDLLEQYASLWSISGKRWYDENDWSMHPRGFGAELTDSDRHVIEDLNEYRKMVIAPLVKLFEVFEKKPTLRDASASLYRFLGEIGLCDALKVRAAELRDKDRVSEADETVQIWNCFIESLDSLVTVAGDMKCDCASYLKLLSSSLEMSTIGKIPSGIDEIVISEASSLRASSVKYVYVMGLNEGVFPAPAGEDIILGDRDRRDLLAAGIELSPESTESAREEMFYLYLAGSAAERGLTFTYNKSKGTSTFLASVTSLYGDLKITDISTLPKETFVWSDTSALEYAVSVSDRDAATAEEIKKYLKDRGNIGFFEETSLIDGTYRYTGGKALYGDYMGLSQARLEQYALCPFAYFCKYVLSVSQTPSAEASSSDVGNFVHSFLERFVPRVFGDTQIISHDKMLEIFEETVRECEKALGDVAMTPRVKMLTARLKNNLAIVSDSLVREFEHSASRPKFYELKIGGEGLEPITVDLPDGGKVGIYGTIDRVDTYECDGEVYIRVTDYKSGSKTFSRAELAYGLNMQMLLYLESICKTRDKRFLDSLGVKDEGAPIPTGVLYFSTKMPDAETVTDDNFDKDEVNSRVVKKFSRIGLVCSDTDILRAMDDTEKGDFLPVTFLKSGDFSKNSQDAIVDSFDTVFDQIDRTVSRIAMDMRSGISDAEPLKTDRTDACRYCDMAAICRRKSYCAEHSEILHGVPGGEEDSEGGAY